MQFFKTNERVSQGSWNDATIKQSENKSTKNNNTWFNFLSSFLLYFSKAVYSYKEKERLTCGALT